MARVKLRVVFEGGPDDGEHLAEYDELPPIELAGTGRMVGQVPPEMGYNRAYTTFRLLEDAPVGSEVKLSSELLMTTMIAGARREGGVHKYRLEHREVANDGTQVMKLVHVERIIPRSQRKE